MGPHVYVHIQVKTPMHAHVVPGISTLLVQVISQELCCPIPREYLGRFCLLLHLSCDCPVLYPAVVIQICSLFRAEGVIHMTTSQSSFDRSVVDSAVEAHTLATQS